MSLSSYMSAKDRTHQLHRLVASLFLLVIVLWQVLLLSVAIWGVLPHPIDWKGTWEISERFSATLQNVATSGALVVAGVWTYYLFVKGRAFKSRLEPKVTGELLRIDTKRYIRISAELTNVGSSKVEITREGLYLDVFAQRARREISPEHAASLKVLSTRWDEPLLFHVLTRHDWIEPTETIRDQVLVEILTSDIVAYRIDFVIFASGMRWTTTSIVVSEINRASY